MIKIKISNIEYFGLLWIFWIKISGYFRVVWILYNNLFFQIFLDTFNKFLNYKYIFSYVITYMYT